MGRHPGPHGRHRRTGILRLPARPAPPAAVRAAWIAWDRLTGLLWFLNLAAVAQAYQDVFGADPITFYRWPGHARAAEAQTTGHEEKDDQ
jgi:hypothetical protein